MAIDAAGGLSVSATVCRLPSPRCFSFGLPFVRRLGLSVQSHPSRREAKVSYWRQASPHGMESRLRGGVGCLGWYPLPDSNRDAFARHFECRVSTNSTKGACFSSYDMAARRSIWLEGGSSGWAGSCQSFVRAPVAPPRPQAHLVRGVLAQLQWPLRGGFASAPNRRICRPGKGPLRAEHNRCEPWLLRRLGLWGGHESGDAGAP